ncbi:hypothetical protein KDK95_01880 [Actinospica sp. MGRD01-02]|uniref:Uncharacterized protein n=1 Tax=Actinospica acidithermotolerans TaxID=2828514 RepID=A0A941E6W9_9ACTN|nr:hypothetical protein [Actinospica acidithermotolerans]MBR7825038.1 hypothetical protein [Actinospica acidithermotolerans]
MIATVAAAVAGGLAGGAARTDGAAPPARPAAAYLAIAQAGNARLETGFDRLHGPDRADPATADADLRGIAATEHLFDQRLSRLALPAGPERWARTLIGVNEARVALTRQAATSRTPAQLAGYQAPLTAANVPVEQAVRAIRASLGLPPPDTD